MIYRLLLAVLCVALVSSCSRPKPIVKTEEPPPLVNVDRILIEKKEHRMTLFSKGKALRVYQIALGEGGLDPKLREGDKRTPEGKYFIESRNRDSAFYRSLRISYPNARDRAFAADRGASPGGDIMIHGIKNGYGWMGASHRAVDWTKGCIAVTNEEMAEIWDGVKDGTAVEILP